MINTTVDHNGMKVMGYLAEPAGTPKGGMIVIQEWWGLTDDIRAIADRYAAEGYLAFAPDLYHGQVASEPDEARKFVMALERDLAAREIDAGIAWMKDVRGVKKVGCVGYCMGGGLTLATAMRPTSKVDAAHVYYGGGMPSDEALAAIKVPVLGSYGATDAGIPKEQVDRLRAALTKAGVPNDITLYEGAGHSFFNDTKPSFHPSSAADSWTKSLAWFAKYVAA
ncbi:MAG: dienelactone hydrolase family protein [Dehalococcoidia bacterium]|nr:MAG: dienelactone hydrolase family protein [Dehalococcoidia bacterium]